MLLSYLRIALRHLTRNRITTVINIAGLAIGMSTALLIGLWIQNEAAFDHYSPNHQRIAEIMLLQRLTSSIMGSHATPEHPISHIGPTIAPISGTTLAHGYGNIFEKTALVSYPNDHIIGAGDKKLSRQGFWTEPALPAMFGFQMVSGNVRALEDPSTILLSQNTSAALFGSTNPIGKTIRLDTHTDYRVGGVYADLPLNTTFAGSDFLLPWSGNDNDYLRNDQDWVDHSCLLFVELQPGVTTQQATACIKALPTPFVKDWHEELLAYPLDRLHLYDPSEPEGRIHDLWLFGIIGTFVLLLACINFMNLSTARSEKRAKEVSIRKTVGSLRHQLITQFLGESLVTAVLAFLLAILLADVALPGFNLLAAKDLVFPWTNIPFWLAAGCFTLFTGLLAGSYPAFYLSSFNPIHGFTRRSGLPRKILVVTQFTISLSLCIATIVIFRQIGFTKDRPVGYSREGLVTVPINTDTLGQHYDALRNDLLASGLVTHVAASSWAPDGFWSNNYMTWSGMPTEKQGALFRNVGVDPDFGTTVGWTILQGRDFSRDLLTDSSAMLLNEAALKAAGFKNPIGQEVVFRKKTYHIIGVVGDMLTNSPYQAIEPAIFMETGGRNVITLRINPAKPMHAALAGLEKYFRRYNPESPFLYSFIDEVYAKRFAAETREGNIAVVLSALAIFISCLGLFGLASFMAEQRTKEIGVRKVLGAGVLSLWTLLSKDFLKLTILSMFIAMPLMALLMQRWLEKYAVHAPMSWWIFAAAGAGILVVTLATVSFQSLKAALMNPATSLRTE